MEGQWITVLGVILMGIVFITWGHTRGRWHAIPKEQQRPWGLWRFVGIGMIVLAIVGIVQRLRTGHW